MICYIYLDWQNNPDFARNWQIYLVPEATRSGGSYKL